MNVLKAFATVGGATLASRLLGFVRDVLMAAMLGAGPVADAFVVAFRLPNLFRRLFAEGAFNSAFVPLFAGRLETDGPDAAKAFARDALGGLVFVLAILTAIAEIAMPWIMLVYAPGFVEDPEKFDLAVLLTRITFPYLLCMSVIALLSGVLNATGRFAAAAAAPILLNVILIAVLSAIALAGFAGEPQAGIWLAWGVAAAGVAQLVMLVVAARRVGFGIGLGRPVWSPGMKRLVTLGIPGVIAGGVTQINIFIGTIIASMAAGAVSYLYFADRIYQLPLGVIGIALGVVLLPDLARRLKAGDDDGANASLNRSLEYGMLLTLPAAVALALVPEPIISVLFERGRFDADARIATAAALQVFAIGLPAFVLIKVFSPGFFAREDTVTPMRFAAIGVVVNIAGSLALFPVIGHVGIAVATTLSGWINALLLGATLLRRGHWARDPVLLRRLPRMLLATVAMGVVLMGVAFVLADWMAPERLLLEKVVALGVLVGAGISVFFGLAQLTGGADLRQLAGLFRRRGA